MPAAVSMSLPPADPPTNAVLPAEAASSPGAGVGKPPVGSAAWAHARKPRRGHPEPGGAPGWVDRGSRDASPSRTEGLASPGVGHRAGALEPAASQDAALYPAVPHSKTLKRAILRLQAPSSAALAGAQAEPDLAHAHAHPRSEDDGSGAYLLLKSEVRPRLCAGFKTRLGALPAWAPCMAACALCSSTDPAGCPAHATQASPSTVREAPGMSPCVFSQALTPHAMIRSPT